MLAEANHLVESDDYSNIYKCDDVWGQLTEGTALVLCVGNVVTMGGQLTVVLGTHLTLLTIC